MERAKQIFDGDLARVWLAAAVPTGLSLAQASYLVTIIAGLCSIAYTIKKFFHKGKDGE